MVIQEGGINCIKNESRDIHNVTKMSILNQFRSFEISVHKESRKKCINVSTKTLYNCFQH